MTREEALKWLKVINTKKFGWDEFALQESQREIRERCEQGVREAIDMAIEALSAPSGDLISREDAIEAVCGDCTIENRESCKRDGYCYEVRNLMALPSADRPKGEWVHLMSYKDGSFVGYECDQCHTIISEKTTFCPNCGARMYREDGEDE